METAKKTADTALSTEVQREIYGCLRKEFSLEQPYPMARVNLYLHQQGYTKERYGYEKAGDFLRGLDRFLELQPVQMEKNLQFNIVLREFCATTAPAASPTPVTSAPAAQETGTPGFGTRSLDEAERRAIYDLLKENFAFGQEQPMAAVNYVLFEHGYTKEVYGFSKAKMLFQELEREYLTLREAVLGGVPQTMVTLREKNDWQTSARTQEPAMGILATGDEVPPALTTAYVFFPEYSLMEYNQSVTGQNQMPDAALMKQLDEDYQAARRTGRLLVAKTKQRGWSFDLSSVSVNDKLPLEALLYQSEPGRTFGWKFSGVRVKTVDRGSRLFSFANLGPSWQEFLQKLADKALKEPWDFPGEEGRLRILDSYIRYTFARLEMEEKIAVSVDDDMAAFNTGLVDAHFEDIYALFRQKCSENGEISRSFLGFCTESERVLGTLLSSNFETLPAPAQYLSRKEDLLFDLDADFSKQTEHMIVDNIERFPLNFLHICLAADPKANALVEQLREETAPGNRKQLYEQLGQRLYEESWLYNCLNSKLDQALDLAIKQVRWNYKTAVPIYYPSVDSMSMVLPLCLVNPQKPDLAMVVQWQPKVNKYRGMTVLTLEMAYQDARLLCRPNSEWLDVSNSHL